MSSLTLILESYLKRTNSFIRFLLVGFINTLTGLTIMILLINALGLSYWLSTFFGNCIGAFISYLLNRSFTFRSNVKIKKSILPFILVIFTCYTISFTVSYSAVEIISNNNIFNSLRLKENLAVLIGTGFYTILNYFGQKYLVFKT